MNNAQHTPKPVPGNYTAQANQSDHGASMVVVDASSYVVAVIPGNTPQDVATAYLLARAPELLAALVKCADLLDLSDVRQYIGHDLGELSALHGALNDARKLIRDLRG